MARILLVDDDEMVRDLLSLRLETKGFETAQAPDGKAGLALLEAEQFDLVVLDLLMPEMDGLSFLSATREMADLPPILVLSATKTDEAALPRAPGLRVELLRKPASAGVILAAVERILGES